MNRFKKGMRVMFRHVNVRRDHPALARGTVSETSHDSVTVMWDAKGVVLSYHYSSLVEVHE